MNSRLSPGGSAIHDMPAWSGRLLVGTQDGVVELEEMPAGWREANHGLAGHHLCALIGEPRSAATTTPARTMPACSQAPMAR